MKALVFDIGGTSIKYGVCENGTLTQVKETPTEAYCGGRHVLNLVASLVGQKSGYDAIGISTAGQVNPDTGTIIYSNNNIPGYTGMQIRKEFEELFHVPVMVENDVNSAAMGEAIYGAGVAYNDFICITYGTGVGGAIIHKKQLQHGSAFSAGEFGGIVTHGEEKLAGSGLLDGCYERFAATSTLSESARSYDPSLSNGRKIFERITEPKVKAIVDAWIDEIILGLVTIVHIFNPTCIVLGGGIMEQPYIIEKIREKLPSMIIPGFRHVQILPAKLGNSAGLLGIYYLTQQYII